MLSIFPELFIYHFFGITIIRITIGLVLVYLGTMTLGVKKTSYQLEMKVHNYPFAKVVPMAFGLIEVVSGFFLIFGFLTQLTALVAIYIFINLIFLEAHVARVFKYPNIFYLAMILISIAILLIGPGAFSVDLPI